MKSVNPARNKQLDEKFISTRCRVCFQMEKSLDNGKTSTSRLSGFHGNCRWPLCLFLNVLAFMRFGNPFTSSVVLTRSTMITTFLVAVPNRIARRPFWIRTVEPRILFTSWVLNENDLPCNWVQTEKGPEFRPLTPRPKVDFQSKK